MPIHFLSLQIMHLFSYVLILAENTKNIHGSFIVNFISERKIEKYAINYMGTLIFVFATCFYNKLSALY